MEDGLSSIIPSSLAFDIPVSNNHYEEEAAEAADALKREKQIEEDLKNAFDDLSADDDGSQSSDEESINSSHQSRSRSYADNSSVKASFEFKEQKLAPHEVENFLSSESHLSVCPEEHSRASYSEDSHHSDENHSNISIDQRTTESHWNYGNISELNSDIVSNGQHFQHSDITSKNSADYNEANKPIEPVSDKHQSKSILHVNEGAQYRYHSDLQEECRKLQLLYETRGKELEHVKREEIKARETYEHEIKSLKLKLTLIEGEKDRLSSSLKESHKLISDFKLENNLLKGNLTAIELQLSSEKQAKENALSKLESADITIKCLEQKNNELVRSENVVRVRDQNESIVKDLKLRHQKEVFQLKEEIDKLQESLNTKINESESMLLKISQLQQNCEQLQAEKEKIFNKLYASLDASQRQCQKLLESGSITELNVLKTQFQHLQEEKSKVEKHNSALKDEIKSLESELQTSEALRKLALENDIEASTEAQNNKKKLSNQKESSLKTELQQSLKSLQSLRTQNNSLKEKFDELKHQLPLWEEKAKLFESRFKESEANAKEFEKKLVEVLPAGSIPSSEHEKEVNVLQNEIIELKKKLHDVTERFKSLSTNVEKLYEDNKNLKTNISEMLKSHASEKIKAVELCREKYLKIHEGAISKLKEELTSKADKELKNICTNYEFKIEELKKENKLLLEGLYDAKSQYIKICDENTSLQSKIDSISKPKEREEIEREVQNEYEQKLNEMKKQIQEHKNQYESLLKSEIEKVQTGWTEQKMVEIKEFINATKQRLDEEFVKCLEKERNVCQFEIKAEREKLYADYQEKINNIKQKHEAEKENLSTKLREDFQLKWENEIKELQQHHEAEKKNLSANLREGFQLKWKTEIKELQQQHQKEIEFIRQKFEKKLTLMENELKTLKESLYKKSEESEDIQNLKQEFSNQKQIWEKEKLVFINKEHLIDEKLTSALEAEKRLLEKVKKYHKYISATRKKYQEKTKRLQDQNEELKKSKVNTENQLFRMKDQYEENILKMEKSLKKQNMRNSECQTENKVVSHKTLLNVQDMFIQCLKKIADDIKTYLLDSRNRTAEYFKKALHSYHDHLVSKMSQHILKDACSITPNLFIPRTDVNIQSACSSRDHLISPNIVQHQYSSDLKISNSSPIDNLASGDTHKRHESHESNLYNAKIFQNARSTPDSGIRFEDVSFDFVPLRIPDSAFTSTKMPECYVSGGLFNQQSTFPERDSPVLITK